MRQLVKAREDVSKVLDFVHETFYRMPLFVQVRIVPARLGTIAPCRNHRNRTLGFNELEQRRTVITLVRNDLVAPLPAKQGRGLRHIMGLSAGQHKIQGMTERIDNQMNLGAEPAATAPQCLSGLSTVFFNAPAAHGCARTMVLSSKSHSRSGSSAQDSKSCCQMPFACQRAKR